MLTSCAVVVLALALSAADTGYDIGLGTLQANDADADAQLNNTLPAEQYFIDKIFDKYGDKGVITFEVGENSFLITIKSNFLHYCIKLFITSYTT